VGVDNMDANTVSIILGALLAISEALSMIPSVKANGIFQAIYNILRGIKVEDK
jgi:hypothetical protein